MRTLRTSLIARTTVTLAAAGAAAALAGGPVMATTTPAPTAASTPPATGVYVATHKGPSNGLTGVVPAGDGTKLPAWEFTFTTEDGTVSTYCIQRGVFVADKTKHTAVTWAATSVPNLGRITNLAVNHNKIGVPYTDVRWEAGATQVAIWNVADGLNYTTLDDGTAAKKAFVARIKALVSDAAVVAEPNSTVTLKASAVANAATHDATVVADLTGNKSAVAGATVKFVIDGKTLTAVTDRTGHAAVTVPEAQTVRTAHVSAVATTGGGVTLKPSTTGQLMITTGPMSTARATTATIPAAAVAVDPTPTPTPTPTVDPTPAPTPTATAPAPPSELPHTGGTFAPWMVLVAAAVAGGSALGYRMLRRR